MFFECEEDNTMRWHGFLGISAVTTLAVSLMTGSAVGQSGKSDQEQLVGTWALASITVGEGADQTLPYGPSPKGLMMVDASGHFTITVMRSGLPKFAADSRMTGTPEETRRSCKALTPITGPTRSMK